MSKQLVQTVYIPIKEHSEFKILEEGITLQNCYPQEGIVFTVEEYNAHIKEVIEETLKNGAEEAKITYTEEKTWDFTEVDKDSILNTFEQSYKKFKI